MTKKFKTTKRFSLSFLGKEWKEAYIDFESISIKDIQEVFPKFVAVDSDDDKKVLSGIGDILTFLGSKFISGKGAGEDGKLIDLEAGDLQELPAEVLSKALGFLSQGVMPDSPKP